MNLSTKARYSVRAMCRLAQTNKNKPIPLSEIAQKEKISLDYLEQLFNKLKKARLVRSMRGAAGGYILSKKPEEISMGEIVSAVGERVQINNCAIKKCSRIDTCPSSLLWQEMDKKVKETLNKITLADLVKNKIIKT